MRCRRVENLCVPQDGLKNNNEIVCNDLGRPLMPKTIGSLLNKR